jgi:hypothetical protein
MLVTQRLICATNSYAMLKENRSHGAYWTCRLRRISVTNEGTAQLWVGWWVS